MSNGMKFTVPREINCPRQNLTFLVLVSLFATKTAGKSAVFIANMDTFWYNAARGDIPMNKVRILLSGNTNLQYYVDAVTGVGAEAYAKYLPEIDTSFDGLILCGGNDVDPSYYHEPMNGSVEIDSARDQVEFALLKAYLDAGKPVFGICRGMQLINIFFGGSLHQDIPESCLHRNQTDYYITHQVTAVPDSILSAAYGTSFCVNSAHHQAVKRLGDGLRPTAFWEDKYIEAYEHTSLPIFATQWHPERMCFGQKREDTVDGTALFEAFIAMCKK